MFDPGRYLAFSGKITPHWCKKTGIFAMLVKETDLNGKDNNENGKL
jgi:hypothetical protein